MHSRLVVKCSNSGNITFNIFGDIAFCNFGFDRKLGKLRKLTVTVVKFFRVFVSALENFSSSNKNNNFEQKQ